MAEAAVKTDKGLSKEVPKGEKTASEPGDATGTGQRAQAPEAPALDLGTLNRHWYRRCLDWLDERLRKSSSNPTIAQLKELCNHSITDFLTAVTGQARDSGQLQFPADRAYYIPFEGDWAESFNFAKPFYRFSGKATDEQKAWMYDNSIWSFFPWSERFGDVKIDSARSVAADGKTIPFEEMISVRAQFGTAEAARQSGSPFLLEKSLVLRGSDRDYIKRIVENEKACSAILQGCQSSLLAVFRIYELTPGNAAVESLLLRHVTVIRWLTSMVARRGRAGDFLTEQEESFRELFTAFLRYFFLAIPFNESLLPEIPRKEIEEGLQALSTLANEIEAAVLPGATVEEANEATQEGESRRWQVLDELALEREAPFAKWLSERTTEESGKNKGDLWKEVKTDLMSFRSFLNAETERRIEEDLGAALREKLPKAGESRQSLVWAVPDFEKIDGSLPEGLKVQKNSTEKVQALSSSLTEAYQAFFQQFDVVCLKTNPRPDKISAYWRTFGQANRRPKIFSSFEEQSVGLFTPRMVTAQAAQIAKDGPVEWRGEQARSQNFFLRVKICDSLNEPILNGMFVISTDHDEIKFKGKQENVVRKDDLEDLLSFAKVYFFAFRDYLRALDQAQTARDIGQLNQYLYDRRLGDLEQRMQRRVETADFKKGGTADEENWSLFTYEVLNNYGYSLLTKPAEVQTETFPYDRLLIVPLQSERPFATKDDIAGDRGRGGGGYGLPLYLFQSVFVERISDEVHGGHYSLIKPFQSPIEEIKTSEKERFRVKSFQQISRTEDRETRLDRCLEKLYLGAQESQSSRDSQGYDHEASKTEKEEVEPESFVVKLVRGGEPPDTPPCDRGSDWVAEAVDKFWSRYSPLSSDSDRNSDLWREFLRNLTSSLRGLRQENSTHKEAWDEHWFLLRFGLLRVLLSRRHEADEGLGAIRIIYEDDLKLRFDNDKSFNVIELARRSTDDPFVQLGRELAALSEKSTLDIEFVSFLLGKKDASLLDKQDPNSLRQEDPFILSFFQHLTDLVRQEGGFGSDAATWYQPLLTRPVEAIAKSSGSDDAGLAAEDQFPNLVPHKKAALQIQKRIPPYEEIQAGKHALSMFLGLVNLSIGQGKQRLDLRCLVAMIRDYDDTKTGVGFTQEEIQQQLEVDLRDLGLYTTTFFRNVKKFVVDAMRGEINRVLLTDVSQIARNWYSTGMDHISGQLNHRLKRILDDRTDLRLGSLRPELIDMFFDGILDVLLEREERPGSEGEAILLESFPFDRLVHIPLLLGTSEGERLCYARTQIQDRDGGNELYEEIRSNGRTWPKRGGRKVRVLPVRHFGLSSSNRGASLTPEQTLLSSQPLMELLDRISQPQALDALARSLYEADPIQTLAVAGLIRHLVQLGRNKLPADRNHEIEQRLQAVIQDSVRIVERRSASAGREAFGSSDIFSDVYMDGEAYLLELSNLARGQEVELRKNLAKIKCLPVWYEFFAAAEGSPDFGYGLRSRRGESVSSKLFYVYYSLEAPQGFTEAPRLGARFRGIFALIVDDASTDVKNKEGEVADQQDIRTFIHNGVRSLQLILEIQSRENKIRQPGIESFVLGMLHRLKNELGKPAAVLHTLKEKAKLKQEIDQIEGATSAINGLKDLFESLRGLSEIQRGVVPIRSYSTNWLGWLFLAKICLAAQKIADELRRESETTGAEMRELARIRNRAEAELRVETKDPLRTIDMIQREIRDLESVLAGLVALASKGESKPEVVLAFLVFSDEPLEFRGSFQLEEAFNILFENAFQAFWSYLGSSTGQIELSPGVLKVVARKSEEARDQVLIEIGNSSQPIDPADLRVLNDNVPQPMTRQQHSAKSRKRGGSGFGHYYARRVVGDLCGGREARRNLDVRIEYVALTGLAKVRVNLLSVAGEGVNAVALEDLQTEVKRNFDRPLALAATGSEKFRFPASVAVKDLFDLARRLLMADRETVENKLFKWWQSDVCSTLGRRCEKVRQALFEQLKELSSDPDSAQSRAALGQIKNNDVGRIRRNSYHDLRRFVNQLRDRELGLLRQVAESSKPLRKALIGVLEGGTLDATNLLEAAERRSFEEAFEEYEPFLRQRIPQMEVMNTLFADLEQNEYGMPVPSRDRLTSLLAEPCWSVGARIKNGKLHLAISLVDGDPTMAPIDLELDQPQRDQDMAFLTKYRFFGPTFHSYARSFERSSSENTDPVGCLWMEVPKPSNQQPVPSRTIHLVLWNQK
jgi:hypothetical protein